MQNTTVSSSDDRSLRAFSCIGAVAVAYVPLVYGLWLIMTPSDGTSKFGGILLISIGVAICAAVGGLVGAAIGLACSLIAIRDKKKRQYIRIALAFVFAGAAIYLGLSLIVRSVEGSAIKSFLITLKPRIDQFRLEKGALPDSVADVNVETLANPFQIKMSDVTLERDGAWYSLVHIPSGTSIRCQVQNEPDANRQASLKSRLVGNWSHPFLGVGYLENIYFDLDGRFRRVVHNRVGKDIFEGEYQILTANQLSISFESRWDPESEAMRRLTSEEKEKANCWVACAFDSDKNLLLVNLDPFASGGGFDECGIPSRNYERGEFTIRREFKGKTNNSQ